MKKANIYCSLVFLCFLISCQTKQQQNNATIIAEDPIGNRIDSILTPYVEGLMKHTDNNAGIAISITNKNEIIYAHSFGFENIEKEKKADFNSVFHIASVSKPFTAAGIVKLIEQGKATLDDYLIDHIPEFRMKGNGYEKIQIKHILNHTSGIPRHITKEDWENPTYGPNALESNLKHLIDFELEFQPGSQFNYSNSAFDILGIVVSRASGMPFHEFIKKEILLPTDMNQSHYLKPRNEIPENWAVPYSYGIETQKWTPYPYTENYFPSSGLQTTLLDMSRWGMLHLNHGMHEGKQVISKEYFGLLTNPYYDTPWGDKIGLSWFLQSYLERSIIMHTGNDTGFESIMYVYPDEGYSIVVLANRDQARTGRIINAASEILFKQEPKDYMISAKYKFANAYKKNGIKYAKEIWREMKSDTTDQYYSDDDHILTIGAILENGKKWKDSKQVLEYYITINDKSTYAWRLLGNAYLNLEDSIKARSCYEETLKINPNYEKGKIALENLLGEI
jgi:CubicO group peptidase (beta-lactamase class C family)